MFLRGAYERVLFSVGGGDTEGNGGRSDCVSVPVVSDDFGRELRRIPVATPICGSWRSLLLDFARRTLLRVMGM